MARVVVVHGVGQQLETAETLLPVVEPALRGGLNLALRQDSALAERMPMLAPGDVACVGYGDLFRRRAARGALPHHSAADVAQGLETELLLAWWEEAARTEPTVLGPSETSRGILGYAASRPLTLVVVQQALDALTRSRFFKAVSDSLLIASLKQVRRYFEEPDLRSAVRARVMELLDEDTQVVVGHSLGSIVAYEALAHSPQPHWRIGTFVTLGSPLGIRHLTFDRLEPAPYEGVGVWPKSVRRWHNIADAGDVVALVRDLRTRFGPDVQDHLVHNGVTMHDMTAYLTAVETGRAVAEGLAR
ncbi:antibiotic ABC transporter ATP-binding protein [Streptomyces sp. NPDC052236]|uniref:PGAP1-like alpha/beta domain-containing protein n=1 Tax=Streptomyces sp. NPDC052236 TaxID=3365686 RepID=UPI0037CE628F